ncbi:hypothetical protein DM01DRAFT_1404272 [Hesseltinella vesiculosa]|uniref:Large ribosomal subunit protein mL59 domain-containing protein n=1 Tax=Hesseltinella vesiculosa TaxID=101127 RepID=A0A1X2GTZ3_9FUNG|nr:hypothetical protein DM01DRAFT_1404272 [Hesseltinella vesiculosa]
MSSYKVFSAKFISRLANPLKEADVKPQLVFNEAKQKSFWRPPRVPLRVQNDLRKACVQYGIDPVAYGLPAAAAHKPLKYKPNKLEKHERMRSERQETIRKNLEKMPQTIQAWKEDKLKELAKQKTSLPF